MRDIDALTYKYSNVAISKADPRAIDEVASDREDNLDASILARLVGFRDAEIRKRLLFCLVDSEKEEVTSAPEDEFVYQLELPSSYKTDALKVLCSKIHEYLVKGGLLDWYTQMGVNTNISRLDQQVTALESSIVSLIRVPSGVKRPLQPFGPAK